MDVLPQPPPAHAGQMPPDVVDVHDPHPGFQHHIRGLLQFLQRGPLHRVAHQRRAPAGKAQQQQVVRPHLLCDVDHPLAAPDALLIGQGMPSYIDLRLSIDVLLIPDLDDGDAQRQILPQQILEGPCHVIARLAGGKSVHMTVPAQIVAAAADDQLAALPGIQSVQHPLRQLQHLCLGPGVAVGQQGLPILDFIIAHGISSHIRLMPN